jgi:hypothetical protein
MQSQNALLHNGVMGLELQVLIVAKRGAGILEHKFEGLLRQESGTCTEPRAQEWQTNQ